MKFFLTACIAHPESVSHFLLMIQAEADALINLQLLFVGFVTLSYYCRTHLACVTFM
jgi:hypothetical protein